MRYDRLFTKLFCQPVLLESAYRVGLEMALLSLTQGEQPAAITAQLRKVDEDRQQMRSDQLLEIKGDTAIIHIDGVIDKNLSVWDRLCLGATDLKDVDAALARVSTDRSIKNVAILCDSPGGSFPGVPETAGRVAALSSQYGKNTMAFCGDMACSACYWIAAQCDQVFAPASASVGSIGVYLALIDQSRRLEDMGLNVQELKDGKLKTAGAPWKPLSEPERDHLQERVEHIGSMFRTAVTTARPQVQPASMEGQSFIGDAPGEDFRSALDAGLIDAVKATFEEALDEF
jgi:protease-4